MKKIILASSSPRRKKLLEQVGLQFEVIPSNYEEKKGTTSSPHDLVKRHAEGKAHDIAQHVTNSIIIGADSIVYVKNEILEKPRSEKEAKEMLALLSGTSHEVITGVCILDSETGTSITKSASTKVFFKPLSRKEIDWYVSTGEPMDKAGAYAIQEKGALFIERIEGDYNNAVGLPVFSVFETLKTMDSTLFPGS